MLYVLVTNLWDLDDLLRAEMLLVSVVVFVPLDNLLLYILEDSFSCSDCHTCNTS